MCHSWDHTLISAHRYHGEVLSSPPPAALPLAQYFCTLCPHPWHAAPAPCFLTFCSLPAVNQNLLSFSTSSVLTTHTSPGPLGIYQLTAQLRGVGQQGVTSPVLQPGRRVSGCVLATWERPSSTGAWCLGSFGQKHQVTYTNLGPGFDPKQPPSRPWRAEPGFQREQHSRQGLSNEEVLGCRGSEREQEGSPLWLPLSKGSHEAWRLSGAQPEVMCVIQCGSGFPGTQEKAQRDDSSQRTPRLLWIELSYLPMASLQLSGMYCLNLGSLLTPAL